MRLGRLAIPITVVGVVLMLAGAGTASAAARVREPGFGVVHHNGGTWSTRPTTGLLGESRVASAMNNIAGCC